MISENKIKPWDDMKLGDVFHLWERIPLSGLYFCALYHCRPFTCTKKAFKLTNGKETAQKASTNHCKIAFGHWEQQLALSLSVFTGSLLEESWCRIPDDVHLV